MTGDHHVTRVYTRELKDLIYRKIGHQRAENYFDLLKSFFSLKLAKPDFDKSCIRTIGRENLPIHNRLIRSILQNASKAKIPPQKSQSVDKLGVGVANGYQKNCLQSLYGDAFPRSPRKCRSPVSRSNKFRDRPSPLGPLGKSPSFTCEESVSRIQEQRSLNELYSLSSKPPLVEDGEEVEQFSESSNLWPPKPVIAPLGVSMDIDRPCKTLHRGFKVGGSSETCHHRGELPDSRSLMTRLQKKLVSEGVGISVDCVNLINNSLDVFLKRIIEPCTSIARSHHAGSHDVGRRSNQMISRLNGIHQRFTQTSVQPMRASILDFRVAMESNPRLLGEDQSMQLEKICSYALE